MKKTFSYLASAGVLSASLFAVGCGETSTVKETAEVKTPEGTTQVEKSTEVKQTGENPPPVVPAEKPATP